MLETFVNENMATGKRIVVPFTLFVENKDNGKSGYGKFCAEFVKDERAGLDNLLENVQVYILPPALKNRITILRGYQEEQGNVLYGLAVFKEVGSKMNSETANVKADLSALRAMVSQNSVAPESGEE